MLAQCDDLKSQGWVPGDMARPARPARPRVQETASQAGAADFEEDEYYWFEGHRYCRYDEGWRGPGWYWCGTSVNSGPIGWHFWYHFGHRLLNHPVFFAEHHGKPAHEHVAAGTGTGKGSQSGKGGKEDLGNKRHQSGKDEAHDSSKGSKNGKNGNQGSTSAKENSHKDNTGKIGQNDAKSNLAGKEKIVAKTAATANQAAITTVVAAATAPISVSRRTSSRSCGLTTASASIAFATKEAITRPMWECWRKRSWRSSRVQFRSAATAICRSITTARPQIHELPDMAPTQQRRVSACELIHERRPYRALRAG
jgi:hypothetical protein